MKTIQSYVLILILGVAAFGIATPKAFAVPIATLQMNGVTLITDGGILLGARDVTVGALGLFDVDFVVGTCVSEFFVCDNATEDFAFQTEADAVSAAVALSTLVLLDGTTGNFDTVPSLTFGCENQTNTCNSLIPFALITATSEVESSFFSNRISGDIIPVSTVISISLDNSTVDFANFAKFSRSTQETRVPEPATLLLFSAGILGLAGIRRRRQTR